jgi:hypothetical protein
LRARDLEHAFCRPQQVTAVVRITSHVRSAASTTCTCALVRACSCECTYPAPTMRESAPCRSVSRKVRTILKRESTHSCSMKVPCQPRENGLFPVPPETARTALSTHQRHGPSILIEGGQNGALMLARAVPELQCNPSPRARDSKAAAQTFDEVTNRWRAHTTSHGFLRVPNATVVDDWRMRLKDWSGRRDARGRALFFSYGARARSPLPSHRFAAVRVLFLVRWYCPRNRSYGFREPRPGSAWRARRR